MYCSDIWRAVNSNNQNFWIGVSDGQSEGSWRFEDGQPSYNLMFSWAGGEPNNYRGNEDCVYFSRHNSRLNDLNCDYDPNFSAPGVLCQIPNGNC